MDREQKLQLQAWVVENMFACENRLLNDKKRKLFLDMIESRMEDPFIHECFTTFEIIKLKMKNKK